jgi:hypothetical protein
MNVEEKWCEVKKEITENAEKVCGKAKVKRNAKKDQLVERYSEDNSRG